MTSERDRPVYQDEVELGTSHFSDCLSDVQQQGDPRPSWHRFP